MKKQININITPTGVTISSENETLLAVLTVLTAGAAHAIEELAKDAGMEIEELQEAFLDGLKHFWEMD